MKSGYRPVVSVIIVNFRGADDTIACLEACRELNWPRDQFELVVVDNASGDGSVKRIRDRWPIAWIRLSRTAVCGSDGRASASRHSTIPWPATQRDRQISDRSS